MTNQQTIEQKIDRYRRLSDQLCSFHNKLSDRLIKRIRIMDLLMFFASTFLVVTTFLDPSTVSDLNLSPKVAKYTLGIASIILFFYQYSDLL